MYRVIVSNYEERQKVRVLEYLVLLGCDSQWYTVKMLGHLSCMPVVYVTRYTLQTSKDTSNLIQSVVEKLLHFVRLRISISGKVWCFSDLTHLPLEEFLGYMVMLEM